MVSTAFDACSRSVIVVIPCVEPGLKPYQPTHSKRTPPSIVFTSDGTNSPCFLRVPPSDARPDGKAAGSGGGAADNVHDTRAREVVKGRLHLREVASTPCKAHREREDDTAHKHCEHAVAKDGGALRHRAGNDGRGGRLEDEKVEKVGLLRVADRNVQRVDAVGYPVAKEQRDERAGLVNTISWRTS